MEEEPKLAAATTAVAAEECLPSSSPSPEEAPPAPEFYLSSPPSRALVCTFLRAFLERFAEIFPIDCGHSPTEAPSHSVKRPKHIIEASWLSDVLQKTLKEIEDTGSFLLLSKVVSDYEAAARRVPESIEHVKSLNTEMHLLRQQIQAENLAHMEAVVNWNKSLAQMKQGMKDLKTQNKLMAKYRADMAIAKADCKQRLREETLSTLKDDINHLTNQVEVEKRVNTVCADFLKKQNLTLMEEAISLATGHDNDVQYMDLMLNKLRDQKVEKEKLLSELEPRYMAEMLEKEAYRVELERQKNMSIDDLRRMETQMKAATKIQKVWRGHMDRSKHSQELKKIAKKRKELRNKNKKGNDEKKDGKTGGGKQKGGGKKK